MPDLIPVDGNGGVEHCVICGGKAVGPCARCELPVCGDCCVLTEGGAKTYAICLRCERGVGRSLRSAWLGVIGWILLPIALLFGLLVLLHWLFGPRGTFDHTRDGQAEEEARAAAHEERDQKRSDERVQRVATRARMGR
jgi:hypothetical protein